MASLATVFKGIEFSLFRWYDLEKQSTTGVFQKTIQRQFNTLL